MRGELKRLVAVFSRLTVRCWPISDGQGRPAVWSNLMQTIGQVERKWVVKSMQLLTK